MCCIDLVWRSWKTCKIVNCTSIYNAILTLSFRPFSTISYKLGTSSVGSIDVLIVVLLDSMLLSKYGNNFIMESTNMFALYSIILSCKNWFYHLNYLYFGHDSICKALCRCILILSNKKHFITFCTSNFKSKVEWSQKNLKLCNNNNHMLDTQVSLIYDRKKLWTIKTSMKIWDNHEISQRQFLFSLFYCSVHL